MARFLAVVGLFSFLLVPGFAANVVIYDGTGNTPVGADSIAEGPKGISFTNGTASSLIDVKISLTNTEPEGDEAKSVPLLGLAVRPHLARARAQVRSLAPNAGVGSITVSLYSSTTTNPPTPATSLSTLGTLNDTSLTASPALYDFAPGSPISLAAGTRYWIYASTANASVALWAFAADAGTGVPGEFFFNSDESFPNTDFPYIAQITVSTATVPGTPVPPSVILMLIGLACVGFFVASGKFGGAFKTV